MCITNGYVYGPGGLVELDADGNPNGIFREQASKIYDNPVSYTHLDVYKRQALFCNVSGDCVIPNLTASTLYEVPLLREREGLCRVVCRKLGLGVGEPDMRHWQELVTQIHEMCIRDRQAAWCRPWRSRPPGPASGR